MAEKTGLSISRKAPVPSTFLARHGPDCVTSLIKAGSVIIIHVSIYYMYIHTLYICIGPYIPVKLSSLVSFVICTCSSH